MSSIGRCRDGSSLRGSVVRRTRSTSDTHHRSLERASGGGRVGLLLSAFGQQVGAHLQYDPPCAHAALAARGQHGAVGAEALAYRAQAEQADSPL